MLRHEGTGTGNRDQPLTGEQLKLVEAYMDFAVKVGQLAFNRVGEGSMDEDMVQETFLALMQSASRYDPAGEATFKTFAYRRVQGAVIDEARRRSEAKRSIPDDSVLQEIVADVSLPGEDEVIESLDRPNTISLIKKRLNNLAPTQRDVVLRHFIGGEAISAIAQEQNVSFQAINQRKNGALKYLMEMLSEAA